MLMQFWIEGWNVSFLKITPVNCITAQKEAWIYGWDANCQLQTLVVFPQNTDDDQSTDESKLLHVPPGPVRPQ